MEVIIKFKKELAIITLGFILGIFTIFFLLSEMKECADKLVTQVYSSQMNGNLSASEVYLQQIYGNLTLKEGKLYDANGNPLENRFELVDKISTDLSVLATVFVKAGEDFELIHIICYRS